MTVYDNLTAIFNEKWFQWEGTGGIVRIKEEERQASVQEVEVEYHGQMVSINKEIFGKTDFLYKTDSDTPSDMPKLQHSCDGILLIERKEQKFIVLIELKSEYSESNIKKAEAQICASYLRLMALLNCLENEDWAGYKSGIIVSRPVNDEYVTLVQKKRNSGRSLNRYERQCLAFKSAAVKNFPIKSDYARLKRLPVNHNLYFEELPTFHVNVKENHSSGYLNLEDILRKL